MQAMGSLFMMRRLTTSVALVAILLALGALASVPPAQAAPMLPAETLLNSDGTLNTGTGVSGAVDLRGWNVTLDSARGPVFQPAGAPAAPAAPTWQALGTGTNNTVYALAISGSDVYAGGTFTTAGSNPANYIAKWNGTAWSALGTGTDSVVFALAISGGDIYAGGVFTTAGGNPANRIAKYNESAYKLYIPVYFYIP
ncbi:MAG: hypothetical protein L0Y55_16380 [Anaerolineales bacterium]|nr:hypothetical protein [Anaerolineales bacterium]